MKKLSIIIPVYNEEKNICLILDMINKVSLINRIEKEMIIVNDASKDNSREVIKNYINKNPNVNIHYYEHKQNK
jgi:glycosyltransferase involved in cell wall biosynthesis